MGDLMEGDVTRGDRMLGNPVPWRLALGALLGASLLLAAGRAEETGTAETGTAEPGGTATVRLIVDYGDGVQKHFTQLAWREGVTVFEVMQMAARHPRGIRLKHRGRGATVLVTQIDGVENEGGGRNWIYRVNNRVGERSVGICPVEPGDTILWRFETYR